jgi:hypothetical protein
MHFNNLSLRQIKQTVWINCYWGKSRNWAIVEINNQRNCMNNFGMLTVGGATNEFGKLT